MIFGKSAVAGLMGAMISRVFFALRGRALKLEIPDADWEKQFFGYVNRVTKSVGVQTLREANFAPGDVGVRVWRGRVTGLLEGVIFKRISGNWSASLFKILDASGTKLETGNLRPRKRGWNLFWTEISEAGIFNLPDGQGEKCGSADASKLSYVVEINKDNVYRTYRYQVDDKSQKAEKMKWIGRIIAEEFYDGEETCRTTEWFPCVSKFGDE